MTHAPDISVVMAVHNGGASLPETIDSVLGQQDVSVELIVVDDASSDGTAAVLQRYGARVRVLRNATNQGLTRSLIRGCAEARAPLIARQDAGDLSRPRRLAREKALLDADPQTVLVSTWTEIVGPDLEPLSVTRGTTDAESRGIQLIDLSTASGVVDGPTHHGAAMFRAAAYAAAGGYRPQFHYSQDWDLWFRLAERGLFRIVPEALYVARVMPSSISTTAREQQNALAKLAREALVARRHGASEDEILARAAAVRPPAKRTKNQAPGLYFIGEALRRNGDPRATAYLRRAAFEDPTLLRAWVRLAQSLSLRLRGRR